jgi:hypothetical protein
VGESLFLTPGNVKAQANTPGAWLDIGAAPATPVVVHDALPAAWDVVVAGDYAFACDYQKFVSVYNIRDRRWQPVAQFDLPGQAENLALRGTRLYVANHNAGLSIVDVSTPEKPVLVSNLNPKIDCDALAFWKDTAVLYAHWQCKIVLADISDPAQPVVTGECQLPLKIFNGGELEVADGFAYATTTNGLVVVDVRDPAAPKLATMVDLGAVARDVILQDGFAFVATARDVRVLDIRDPAQPVEVGSYQVPATALAVQRKGSTGDYYLYVARNGPGLILVFHPPVKK